MCDEQLSRQWSSRRAKVLFTTVNAILSVGAAGCSTARLPPSHETNSLLVEAKFIDVNGNPVSVDNRPTDSSLTLGVIAGAIAGKPSRTLQVIPIGKLSTIEINLGSFEAAISKQAVAMTAHFADSGLRIDPVDSRFARASTMLRFRGSLPGNLFVGFVDPDSKYSLTLVYFDRPCRVTGVTTSEKLTLTYEVIVEKPGLNWLVRTPRAPGEFVLRVANEPIREMLVIAPVENRKNASFQIN
jgi:hypothetical protein